ncbi:MAG: hypothetical protein RLZZ515_2713 [Cyanobacteriota bacterium]
MGDAISRTSRVMAAGISVPTRRLTPWLGVLGVALPLVAGPVAAEVRGAQGVRSLGTTVNAVRDGRCSSGACDISGGSRFGPNLFHRFEAFDTRGGITGVRIQSEGARNVMVGVLNVAGTYLDQPVSLSTKGNLFWLSPGGIQIRGAGGFHNVQHLQLSTATALKFGSGVWDALNSTVEQSALLLDDPIRGGEGLLTDPAALQELGLQSNGDLSLDGGSLTVDESLLLDSQGGNVLLQAMGLQAPGGAMALRGRSITLDASILDVSSSTGLGGSVLLQGDSLNLFHSRIDASGWSGGGQIGLDGRHASRAAAHAAVNGPSGR